MNDWFTNDRQPEETGSTMPTPAVTPTEPAPAEPVMPVRPTEPAPAEPVMPVRPTEPVSPPMTRPTVPFAPPSANDYVPPCRPETPPVPPTHYVNGPYTPPSAMHSQPMSVQVRPNRRKRRGETVLIAVLAVVCAISMFVSVGLGIYVLTNDRNNAASVKDPDTQPSINENGPTLQISDLQELDDGGLPTREIVEKNVNAAVVLTMYHKESTVNYYNSFFGFYGGNSGSDSLVKASAASGIVMSEDGYIITNSHCVFDEDYETPYARLDVTLYDGRVFENAKVIGYDRSTDLAVIKVDATDLTPAEFGDSSQLALGDRVVTLGNSGGLSWSVSQGILSGQARDVYEDTGYAIRCLQVDAVINPGSSGGPLINAYGQVVGVNSAKIVLEGHEGLGFSIPINEAKVIIDDLIKYGYATGRVSIGILGRTVTSIGYEGFIIDEILEDSPLRKTDVKQGDIITHVNGVRVMNYAEMRAELVKGDVGETVTLSLIRYDPQTRKVTEFDVKIPLGEMK